MASTYFAVSDLPQTVQSALRALGYNRADISVSASETFDFSGAYGDGYRATNVLLNLSTGEQRSFTGSWGGANPFSKPADQSLADSGKSLPLPEGFAGIHSQQGGGKPVSASMTVHPRTLVPMLPAPVELSAHEAQALRAYGYKPGEYRKRELRDVPAAVLDGLVSRGLLSRNRAGATQLTTAGRNAKPKSY